MWPNSYAHRRVGFDYDGAEPTARPGAGYLYVRRDLWPEMRPAVTGWAAHRDPFAFDRGSMEYAEDALRFFGAHDVRGFDLSSSIGCSAS